MSRYPEAARNAAVKCILCNAPTTITVDGHYVCVGCGRRPVSVRSGETTNDVGGGR